MCRAHVPTLRVVQNYTVDIVGELRATTYALQVKDENGHWKDVPVVHRYPPVQLELPLEDRLGN